MKVAILIAGFPRFTEYFNWNITNVFDKIDHVDFEIHSCTWNITAENLLKYKSTSDKNQTDTMMPSYDSILHSNNNNEIMKKLFSNTCLVRNDFNNFCHMTGRIVGLNEVYKFANTSEIDYFLYVRTDSIFDPESFISNFNTLISMLKKIKDSGENGMVIPLTKFLKGYGVIGDWWWAFDKNTAKNLFDNFYEKFIDLFTNENNLYHMLSKPDWMYTHLACSCWFNYNDCHTIDFNYVNGSPIGCILIRHSATKIKNINDLSYKDWVDLYYEVQEQMCISPVEKTF